MRQLSGTVIQIPNSSDGSDFWIKWTNQNGLQGPVNCVSSSRVSEGRFQAFQECQEFQEFQEIETHFKSISRDSKR